MHVRCFERRYAIMRALNPNSLYQRYGHASSWSKKRYYCDRDKRISCIDHAVASGLIREEWDPTAWYGIYGGSGLIAFNSKKCFKRLSAAIHGDVSRSLTCVDTMWKRISLRG